MSLIAYVAQPIDQAYDITVWGGEVHKIAAKLNRAGYHTYQPARAWSTVPGQLDPRVESVNDCALRQVDLLVAYLPPAVPTIGVPLEIARAIGLRIPVIVVTKIESYALQRDGIVVVDHPNQLPEALERIRHHREAQVVTEAARSFLDASKLSIEPVEPIQLVVTEGLPMPARAYPDDAGLDLTTAREYTIRPGQFVDAHTQVDAVQLPPGHWGMITGRSSTLRKLKLHVPVAVIDPGYRGPLFVGVWNLSRNDVVIRPGDRLGQLILMPNTPAPVVLVEKVDDAARGLAGFGSSGT